MNKKVARNKDPISVTFSPTLGEKTNETCQRLTQNYTVHQIVNYKQRRKINNKVARNEDPRSVTFSPGSGENTHETGTD